jgi:predicted metal-dependent hydrolase
MDLFDQRYFWEAHEAWEGLWHQLPRQAPRAQLLQGLIQISAAVLKSHLGEERAARSLLKAAWPRVQKGGWLVDGERLLADTQSFLEGGPWPLI